MLIVLATAEGSAVGVSGDQTSDDQLARLTVSSGRFLMQ